MKRFSNMFSVTMLVPSACVASVMNCACISVGKPGNSSVTMSTAFSGESPITRTPSPLTRKVDAAFPQLLKQGSEMGRVAACHHKVAAGERGGNYEGAGLDPIRDDAVTRAMQFGDSLHADGVSPCAFYVRAHLVSEQPDRRPQAHARSSQARSHPRRGSRP